MKVCRLHDDWYPNRFTDLGKDIDWVRVVQAEAPYRTSLSRNVFLRHLAYVYAGTGDERYASKFAELLSSWLDTFPIRGPTFQVLQGAGRAENVKLADEYMNGGYRLLHWFYAIYAGILDFLTIQVFARGRLLLGDPRVDLYHRGNDSKRYRYHNVVLMDGKEPSPRVTATIEKWQSDQYFDFFRASHPGFLVATDGTVLDRGVKPDSAGTRAVTCRREVLYVRGRLPPTPSAVASQSSRTDSP